jgi:hypothetical protein
MAYAESIKARAANSSNLVVFMAMSSIYII